jgi:hypothetical protein
MARYLNLGAVATPTSFSDVAPEAPFASAVAAAVTAGVVVPASATRFGPNDAVSRQELATTLATGFSLTEPAVPNSAKSVPAIADEAMIASGAANKVKAVLGAGYMKLGSDNAFSPNAAETRAGAAQALYSAIRAAGR